MMRMKKHILILLLLAGMGAARAQFSITAVQPPAQFVYEDLWHLSVSGPSSSNYTEFYISLRIYDEQGNLEVKSNSSPFAFSYLPLYVNKTNLGPLPAFQTLYYNSTMLQSVIQSGGYFPAGTYNIQFVLFGRPTDGEFTELNDYTYQVVIEAMWPPMLLTPYDGDTIDTHYPLLTWTPAYISGSQQILYELYLTEMNENQTPYMAITSNPSLFNQKDMPGTVLPYPPSAAGLEINQWYAWQVVATVNGQPVGYSQVWSFIIGTSQQSTFDVEPYTELFFTPTSFVYRAQWGKLRIKYVEEYVLPETDDDLFFNVYNWRGQVIMTQADDNPHQIAKGHNYIEINVAPLVANHGNGPFLLEVYNHKNEKQYVRFFIEGVETEE